jgi:hypothetical protein
LAIKLVGAGQFNAAKEVQGISGTQIEEVLVAIDDGAFILHLVPLGVMLAAASAIIIKTRVLPV